MKTHFLLIVVLVISGLAAMYGQSYPRIIQTLDGREITAAEMDDFLEAYMDSLNVKGISIAIINDGTVVYHHAVGTAGIANACALNPVTDQTLFQAASISKPIFAYFVMKMVDKGLLDLDTPLYKYLPYPDIEDDPRYKLITARMVLCHKTGFPNWRPDYTGKLTLEFTPGTQFSYSGEGYMYLAKVIAHLTNTTLANLDSVFQKEVCEPLKIEHAYFGLNDYAIKHLARGYFNDWIHEDLDFIMNFNSAGGLCTEAKSFANFLIALMNDTGLSKESMDEMLKAQVEIPADDNIRSIQGFNEYSLGFDRKIANDGEVIFAHGGSNWGFSSYFMFSKEKKFGFVFFTNSNSCDNPQCPELWQRIEPFLIDG